MYSGKMVFSQVIDFLPLYGFNKCIQRYNGNKKIKSFSCLDQFLCMAFAQLTFRESLRDIEACLRSLKNKLYHLGIRGKVSRSTLADANNIRDWRIYADFAQVLIHTARSLYSEDAFGVELDNTVYALDSTTIDLCLSLFPWAAYCKKQAGLRAHTLLDLRGSIPAFVEVTRVKGKKSSELSVLSQLIPEPGSFYIMDRGYLSFKHLYVLDQASAFFVVRSKKKIHYRRLYSCAIDKTTGLRSDQTVILTGQDTPKFYPDKLRRIVFYSKERNKRLVFFTNNFQLSAETIAQLYKQRWKIELFFKWIKQHLRIKKFFGTSENAVKTQIWIAISVYVLVAIIKKRMNLKMELYTILQILSVSTFEKMELSRLLNDEYYKEQTSDSCNQLQLFN
ncbi:MAG: IS4 family transposase [Candidatus Omnitrophica bacterium]|nr:IS4 family transposase [Candidatus Omnitrophota bacterium]